MYSDAWETTSADVAFRTRSLQRDSKALGAVLCLDQLQLARLRRLHFPEFVPPHLHVAVVVRESALREVTHRRFRELPFWATEAVLVEAAALDANRSDRSSPQQRVQAWHCAHLVRFHLQTVQHAAANEWPLWTHL
jgi:hypothetical protein